MPFRFFAVLALLMSFSRCLSPQSIQLSRTVQEFLRVSAPKVVQTTCASSTTLAPLPSRTRTS